MSVRLIDSTSHGFGWESPQPTSLLILENAPGAYMGFTLQDPSGYDKRVECSLVAAMPYLHTYSAIPGGSVRRIALVQSLVATSTLPVCFHCSGYRSNSIPCKRLWRRNSG